jgi:sterol desaturase/sphingolipid hydroxylase (fatty acid hydroxylase superfamily)
MRTEKKQAYLSNENISVPLFKNKWLDSLTRTHIAIPVTMFFLYAIALLYYTKVATDLTTLQVTSLYLTGFLFFTLAEYMVHRHVYHLPGTTEKRAKFAYTMHGVHHDYPKDKQRLAMPPAMSVAVGTILFFLFELIITLGSKTAM